MNYSGRTVIAKMFQRFRSGANVLAQIPVCRGVVLNIFFVLFVFKNPIYAVLLAAKDITLKE